MRHSAGPHMLFLNQQTPTTQLHEHFDFEELEPTFFSSKNWKVKMCLCLCIWKIIYIKGIKSTTFRWTKAHFGINDLFCLINTFPHTEGNVISDGSLYEILLIQDDYLLISGDNQTPNHQNLRQSCYKYIVTKHRKDLAQCLVWRIYN